MIDIHSRIEDYYPRVDACDFDWIVGIFASDAVYQRAEAQYAGIAEIERFFRVERQIRGSHVIADMWSDPHARVVWATGLFEGKGALGDARSTRFADMWRFNESGLIERRETYLAIGSDYVRS